MSEAQKRLWQTLRLVEKEGVYLQDVAGRLFAVPEITAEWIERLISTPEGRDRLELVIDGRALAQDLGVMLQQAWLLLKDSTDETDRKLAFYPDSLYLIMSLSDRENPVLRAFRIVDDRITEEELVIT